MSFFVSIFKLHFKKFNTPALALPRGSYALNAAFSQPALQFLRWIRPVSETGEEELMGINLDLNNSEELIGGEEGPEEDEVTAPEEYDEIMGDYE